MDDTTKKTLVLLPRPGEVVDGRYQLQQVFASGGMGVIMRATQLRTGRSVAVKLLHPHVAAKGNFATRFKREVTVATLFDHPHIVRVYDVGETKDGALYLVMELLDGEELKDIITRDAPLSADRVFEIGLQMLDGLAEAHSQDVVHRDFKPSNVFVGKTRRGKDSVKLLDFGIAKLINSNDSELTATGSLTGTPSYVAPETMLESEYLNKKAADVYAAGLVLLEMLTGQRVFDGATMAQTLLLHLKKPVILPEAVDITPLGEVIRRATAKHPDDRYPDADAMFTALGKARRGTPKDLRLTSKELPGPTADTSPSLLEQLSTQGVDTSLDMLRNMPQHSAFISESSPDLELEPTRDVEVNLDDFEMPPTEIISGFEPDPTLSSTTTPAPTSKSDPEPDPRSEPLPEPEPEFEPDPTQRNHYTALIGGIIVLFSMVAILLFTILSGTDEKLPEETLASAPEAVEEPKPEPEPEPDPEPILVEENRVFYFESAPSGATLWRGEEEVGTTPLEMELALEGLPLSLRLEKEDHLEQLIDIDEETESRIELVLEPEEVESTRPPARRTPPRAPARRTSPEESETAPAPDVLIDQMVDEFLPD